MKKLSLALMTAATLSATSAMAQHFQRSCGAGLVQQKMAAEYPAQYNNYVQQRQQAFDAGLQSTAANKTTATPVIPVVFHIVLTQSQFDRLGGNAGIQQRVTSQMEVLNLDYQRMNADTSQVYAPFKPLIGNPDIRFGLAARTPSGASTPGFEIKIVNNGADTLYDVLNGAAGSGFACSDAKYAGAKGLAAWDVSKYINIWVVRITNGGTEGILGISTSPALFAGTPYTNEVGIVLTHGAFGKRASFFDYYLPNIVGGRTLTHEMGHFFELKHIWGESNNPTCNDDDGIGDTPVQYEENYGCPSAPTVSCNNGPNGDMFMNYMDYVNDNCMHMFTAQQASVMHNLAVNSTLSQHPELLSVGNIGASGEDFQLLPNPATSSLNISFGKGLPSAIRIMNSNGALAYSTGAVKTGNSSIDVSALPRGVYFVQCIFADGTIVKKVVLQ